jgi:hypothetical protein
MRCAERPDALAGLFPQLIAVGLHEQERVRHTRTNDDLSIGFEHLQGLLKHVAAERVLHDVVVVQHRLEPLLLVVDDDIRAWFGLAGRGRFQVGRRMACTAVS